MRTFRRSDMARTFPVREVKLLARAPEAVSADGAFEGYASLFGIADLGKDLVEPGAFAASLARRGLAGVKLLWQHDPAEPLGRWLSLVEDARGLMVRGRLNLAVERARDIHALMRDGAIDGLSIGFRAQKARTDPRTGVRRLLTVDLWEISIVTFPMLPGARVSAVKTSPRRGEVAPKARVRGPRRLESNLEPSPVSSLRSSPTSPHRGEVTLAAAIRRAASLIDMNERN